MAWSVSAEPERFDEAVSWFANRVPVTAEMADELDEYAASRAFKIAGVAQLDIVQDVHESLLKAIETGIPFEEWRRDIEATLTKAWGNKKAHRIETIFRNATQQSYSAGRWRQMNEPDVLRFRPWGMYDAVVDDRTTELCRTLDGTILPLEDFATRGICPQNHHRCRAGIRNLRDSDARRREGFGKDPPDVKVPEGFGKAPTESDWQPKAADYDAKLFAEYERRRKRLEDSGVRHRVPVKDD